MNGHLSLSPVGGVEGGVGSAPIHELGKNMASVSASEQQLATWMYDVSQLSRRWFKRVFEIWTIYSQLSED